jgi:hypothetical protein
MLDRLDKAFNHKNHRVRQSVNELIRAHLQQHGLADMSTRDIDKQLVPRLVVALSDSQLPVRSESQEALAVLYSFMGEELNSLLTKHSIRPAQMRELKSRFEKIGGPMGVVDSESSQCASILCCSHALHWFGNEGEYAVECSSYQTVVSMVIAYYLQTIF